LRGGRVVNLMQSSRSFALSTSNGTALKKLHCNASRRDCANCPDIRCILNSVGERLTTVPIADDHSDR
jgi:hypothetical protein